MDGIEEISKLRAQRVPMRHVRPDLSAYAGRILEQGERFIVTSLGRAIFAMVPLADLRKIEAQESEKDELPGAA